MKSNFVIVVFIVTANLIMAQSYDFELSLYNSYENYRETTIENRRFKHSDLLPLIEELKHNKSFRVDKAGESVQGRDIYLISTGTGKTKIFLWSQMHGDEPTATAAFFDIFNFLSANNEYNTLREELLKRVTLYFLPMVNPDGAEVFERRNVLDIDLNRDAVRRVSPEALILKNVFDSLKADFGFNMHDQSIYYSAGNSHCSAAISFLAPPVSYDKRVTKVRERSTKLIGAMFLMLKKFIPGHIAKYSDDYEPRAFGDNFQKWGTSTVLVESGGWRDDPEKQYLRKINFILLLSAFKTISEESFNKTDTNIYYEIPSNEKLMMDLILRNVELEKEGKKFVTDIGIIHEEKNLNEENGFYYKSSLEDIGDLSVFTGYEDLTMNGYKVVPAKVYSKKVSFNDLDNEFCQTLLKKGIAHVMISDIPEKKVHTWLPLIIHSKNSDITDSFPGLEENPTFFLSKDDQLRYAVINGFLIHLNDFNFNGNGVIDR